MKCVSPIEKHRQASRPRLHFSSILCLSLTLAQMFVCASKAAVLKVGSPDGPSTISAALDIAEPGDTVLVGPGDYKENLIIEKPVNLVGEGNPQIRGTGQGDVVLVLADDVEMRGFSISGSGRNMMVSDAGIKIVGHRARVRENLLSDNLFGIYLKVCTEALIEGNSIRGRPESEIGKRGAGVHLYDAHHNVVRLNRITEVRDGVYFDHSDFNLVEQNEFSRLRYGVHYMYCEDNTFLGNTFRDSFAGVAVMYTERVTFRDNRIVNNRASHNSFGLLLKECNDSVAERNIIVNNVRGIFLDNSHKNRFLNNLVAYNDVAVVLYASSLENSFSANDFVGNLSTLHTVGKADADWTPQGQGNYFSDYMGYDVDSDGTGDLPHKLQGAFEVLEGNRPLLRLYLNSAAADALSLAERSFPLVPSSDELDRAPSMRPVSGARMEPAPEKLEGSSVLVAGSVFTFLFTGWLSWRFRR